jgi:hypothetical protein
MHIVNSLMQCLALKHPESPDPLHGFKKAELGPQFHSLPNGCSRIWTCSSALRSTERFALIAKVRSLADSIPSISSTLSCLIRLALSACAVLRVYRF